MLKIHKLTRDQLVPGVEPPARLVTALQEGISKRSDVFLAERFLKDLEMHYCIDLLQDTNSALRWLDKVNKEYLASDKKKMRPLTFDFKALYDNLNPDIVKKAVEHAIMTCYPDWSSKKRQWILNLIDVSLRSSVGKYKGKFYVQKKGVPTGGSLCVQSRPSKRYLLEGLGTVSEYCCVLYYEPSSLQQPYNYEQCEGS